MDTAKTAVGTILGMAFVGGLFFFQCVYPFINDTSETWSCDSEEVSTFCDDPYTVGGFAAELCGRSNVSFLGDYIKVINQDPTFQDPRTYIVGIRCPEVLEVRWEFEGEIESIEEARAVNEQTRLFERLLREYSFGALTIGEARRLISD